MSVFKVNLNNAEQGLLDKTFDSTNVSGAQVATSKQRTVYIMGPGKINRKLNDGDTFQDCNYYKRFCYPQATLQDAILSVVTDDGSVYSDVATENTFPYVYSKSILGATTYTTANNIVNILSDAGGYASFVQLTNSGANDVLVRLNGSTNAVFTLEDGTTQVFDAGDLQISLIEISNNTSGAATIPVEILCSVKSTCNS